MRSKKAFIGGTLVLPDRIFRGNLIIENGVIQTITTLQPDSDCQLIDVSDKVLLPGVIDTHVHMWDPHPQNYREDWEHGSRCAASGGITTIVDMPLSVPPVTNETNFKTKLAVAKTGSCVDFAFWGGLIPSCIDQLAELDKLGCVAYKGFISFANPDYPQITDGYLIRGMREAAKFNGLIGVHAENAEAADFGSKEMAAIHCQDESMHDDARPWWVELEAIQRAILFAKATKSRLYICHMSISQGAQAIKMAKAENVPIYLETCPHYLLFDKTILREKKQYAKCNPPLRSRENVDALWSYIFDGTIDTIGSDHSPYLDEERAPDGNFWNALCGFGGFDAMLPGLIDEGVNHRGLPLTRLAELTSGNAAKIMGLFPKKGSLIPGADADIAIVDLHKKWVYDGAASFSKVKSVHGVYQGRKMEGKVESTYVRGNLVYDGRSILVNPGYGQYVPRQR